MSATKSEHEVPGISAQQKPMVVIAVVLILFLLLLPFSAELNGEEGPAMLAFFGRFHILALHLPIGWLMLVPILEFIGMRRQSENIRAVAGIVLLIGALSAVLAATLGFSLAVADAYAGSVVRMHMWMGIITATSALLAILSRQYRTEFGLSPRVYPAVLTVCLLAMTYGGHLGGTLVQGEGYLTAKLPANIKRLLNIPSSEPIPIDYDADIYAAIIQPIFRDNCYSCHNDQRYRGRLSMASHGSLMAGTNGSEEVVIPGDHEASELHRRIVLNRSDDDVMPPAENPPLAESDVALISWWIDIGAPSGQSINNLMAEEYPQNIANIVDGLIADDQSAPTMPAYDPEFIALHAETLKSEFDLDVYPVSQELTDGLRIETTNRGEPFDGETLQALATIAEYVRTIDISGAEFEAGEFSAIANFTNLEQLTLDNASIPSDDLAFLTQLQLESLNLYGTPLELNATEYLVQLRTLQNLYLAQTGLGIAEAQALALALPRCEILLPGFVADPSN